MTIFAEICIIFLPAILAAHYIGLFADSNSRYQKKKFKKSLDVIYDQIKLEESAVRDGIRFKTVKVIHKNREFNVGIIKQEHSFRYTTYAIFINGDEAGVYHQVGDCCTKQFYFEKQNNREQYEVMEIVNACAKMIKKEINKRSKEVAGKINSWNEYSYFK